MHLTSTILATSIAVSQVTATGGWGGTSSYSTPDNTNNKCSTKQASGYDWAGLDAGTFERYGSNKFSSWKCSNSFGKRDLLTKRTFQSKCITADLDKEPAIDCDGDDKMSIKKYEVSSDQDADIECHYEMPDGSTCKEVHSCKASGSVIENTQCGGAKKVTFKPYKSSKGKGCNIGIHSIDFDCNTASVPIYATPSATLGTSIHPAAYTTSSASSAQSSDSPPPGYGSSSVSSAQSSVSPPPGYGSSSGSPPSYETSSTSEGSPPSVPSYSASAAPSSSTRPQAYETSSVSSAPSPHSSAPEYGSTQQTPSSYKTSSASEGSPVTSSPVLSVYPSTSATLPVYGPSLETPPSYDSSSTSEVSPVASNPVPSKYSSTSLAVPEYGSSSGSAPGYGASSGGPSTYKTLSATEGLPVTYSPVLSVYPSTSATVPEYGSSSVSAPGYGPSSGSPPSYETSNTSEGSPVTTSQVSSVSSSTSLTVPGYDSSSVSAPGYGSSSGYPPSYDSSSTSEGSPVTSDPAPSVYPSTSLATSSYASSSAPVPSYVRSSESAETPVPTTYTPQPESPDVLPKCLNTWMYLTTCKGNDDYDCFCKNADFMGKVYNCLSAWSETDDDTNSGAGYLMGLCAKYIPENPAIITACPSTITPATAYSPTTSKPASSLSSDSKKTITQYSTIITTIASCNSEVKDCPATTLTSTHILTTTLAPPATTTPPPPSPPPSSVPCTTITYSATQILPALYSTGESLGSPIPSSSYTTSLLTTITVPRVQITTHTVTQSGTTQATPELGYDLPALPTSSSSSSSSLSSEEVPALPVPYPTRSSGSLFANREASAQSSGFGTMTLTASLSHVPVAYTGAGARGYVVCQGVLAGLSGIWIISMVLI